MNIYLIRHGDAESVRMGMHDSERQLTEEGISSLTKAAEGWKKLVPGFDFIVSSPLLRAIQTANIIKNVFDYKNEILIDKAVISGKAAMIAEMANALKAGHIAFCGHEPDCSQYVSEFTSVNGSFVNYKKGMIAKISFGGKARVSGGYLDFLIPVKAYK